MSALDLSLGGTRLAADDVALGDIYIYIYVYVCICIYTTNNNHNNHSNNNIQYVHIPYKPYTL